MNPILRFSDYSQISILKFDERVNSDDKRRAEVFSRGHIYNVNSVQICDLMEFSTTFFFEDFQGDLSTILYIQYMYNFNSIKYTDETNIDL